jgi:hypothetical protein
MMKRTRNDIPTAYLLSMTCLEVEAVLIRGGVRKESFRRSMQI